MFICVSDICNPSEVQCAFCIVINKLHYYPASKSTWLSRGSHVALSWLPRRKRYVETTWFCRVAATSSPRFVPRLYHVIGGIFYVDTTWFCRVAVMWSPREKFTYISHYYHVSTTFIPRYRGHYLRGYDVIL
jgi:hypothetical protein